MKIVRLRQPASLENLQIGSAERRPPGPGEVVVRIHASSLNYHDYAVVMGQIVAADGRIPMSDGAGEVVDLGPPLGGLVEQPDFKVGDAVVSTFFPRWLDGPVPWTTTVSPGSTGPLTISARQAVSAAQGSVAASAWV